MPTQVFCTTQFEGFHLWKDAPDEVAFLRDLHRHQFHVKLYKTVNHADRETEFILMKRLLDLEIKRTLELAETVLWSCEAWAERLVRVMQADECQVSEDAENGARAYR